MNVDYAPNYFCRAEYELIVTRDGLVASVDVVSTRPADCAHTLYHRQLVSDMERWRYEVTRVDGRAISVCVPFTAIVDLRRPSRNE